MLDILRHDVRTGPGSGVKLGLTFLGVFTAIFALVAVVSEYTSPYVLCPPLFVAAVMALYIMGQRVSWQKHGKMPPLQRSDMHNVRHWLLNQQIQKSYERRLHPNASRHRGVARV